ncbi:MAG: hypothetical protein KAQ93_00055 [Spirochaetales bacterium]|nr:hypothetical protein [Spirochaetales bacterium]
MKGIFSIFSIRSIKGKILLPIIILLVFLGVVSYVGISMVFVYTNKIVQESNTKIFKETVNVRVSENVNQVYLSILNIADRALQEASFFTKIPDVHKAFNIALSGNIEDENSPEGQRARELLRKSLKPFIDGYKEKTGRPLLKLHFHLSNSRSLVRLWRDGYQTTRDGVKVDISDDLSSFRNSVLQINGSSNNPITGVEVGRGGFAIRGIASIDELNGRHLGSVEVLFAFNEIFDIIKTSGNVDYAVYMNADLLPIAKSLADPEKYPVLDNKYVLTDATNLDTTNPLINIDILDEGKNDLYTEKIGGYIVSVFPVWDFSGQSVGVIVQAINISEQVAAFENSNRILDALSNTVSTGTVAIFLIVIILLILILYIILNKIMKSLNNFQVLFNSGAKGDLTVQSANKSKDEIGHLSVQFNNFIKQLGITISKIKSSSDTVDAVKDSLAASAEETSATIINIKNSTASLLKESEKMDMNVSDNVASVEEITANINSIKEQINEQVAMVEESTAAITEMISSLHSVDNITRKKADSVLRLVTAIKGGNDASAATDIKFQVDVIDKIDGISGMATSIQAIAAQTNLLSMNAAIEAAHAGDAGKGFAVVADEIRKLADTSSKSSTSITKIIKEISDGIAGTGEVAQKKVDAFVIMNKEIIETKNAFDEIVTSVQELNAGGAQIQDAMVVLQDVSSNIKNAAVEMTVGAEQVMKSQLELKDISHKVNSGMQEISSGSEEIVIASDEIVRYSSELNSVVNDLKDGTDKFKT